MIIEIYERKNSSESNIESVRYFADNEQGKIITDSIDVQKGLTDKQIISIIEAWINQESLFDKFPNKIKIYQAWKFMENTKGKLWSEYTENEKNNFMKIVNRLIWREFRQLDLD